MFYDSKKLFPIIILLVTPCNTCTDPPKNHVLPATNPFPFHIIVVIYLSKKKTEKLAE